MKLDDITANIRLRSPWEAIDLGFTLVQHNARWIFPAWTLLLFSFALILWLLMPDAYKAYVPLALWWLKPVYDRVLLHILSYQMFDQRLSTADIFSAIPGLVRRNGLLGGLSLRRLSISRGFNLPIWQLEGLRGKPRKLRQDLLHLQAHQHAVWLTVACSHLEWVVLASLYVLVMVLDPTDVASEYIFGGVTDTFDTDAQYWGNLIFLLFYMVAVWIVEPLYVAGSFSLYLNRRTQLEAWDIELAFRNLGERLGQLARLPLNLLLVTLMITGSVASLSPVPADAAEAVPSEYLSPERLSPPESAQQIGEIMQSEELSGMHTRKVWMPREQDQDTPEDSAAWVETLQLLVANITKIALWIGVIVLLVMAFVYRQRILALLKPARRKLSGQRPPDILFGMDIRPESLPDDIASACRKLWETGQQREALSLLYRATLMRLTRHERLAIQDSHTEGDILQLARPHLSAARMAWLTAVTHVWQEIAYAHRIPEDAQVIPLFGFDYAQPPDSLPMADSPPPDSRSSRSLSVVEGKQP